MPNFAEATYEASPELGWNAFVLSSGASSAFSTSSTTPTYLDTYGTYRGDRGIGGSGSEQSASVAGQGSAFSGDSVVAQAKFAFKIRRIALSTSASGPTDVANVRDVLVWSRFQRSDGVEVSDGVPTFPGAPFKMSVALVGGTNILYLHHVEGGLSVSRDPTTGIAISGLLNKWMAMEWTVYIRRGVITHAHGINVQARLWYVETRKPMLAYALSIDYPIPTTTTGTVFTQSYRAIDVLVGAKKLRTSGTDDEIDIDYDEIRAGNSDVAFPRGLYGGPFRCQVSVDKYEVGGVGSQNNYSRRWIVPPQFMTSLQFGMREHFLSTDMSCSFQNPGTIACELGTVTAAGGSATSFKTSFPIAVTNFYVGYELEFTSGLRIGERSKVTAFNFTTDFVTVSPAFSGAPANADKFRVIRKLDLLETVRTQIAPQYRVEVIASDQSKRRPDADTIAYSDDLTRWDEFGRIYWSGFIDTIETSKDRENQQITLRGYGVSEFMRRLRSLYKKTAKGGQLGAFVDAITGSDLYDTAIDLEASVKDTDNVKIPFESFGEEYQAVNQAVARILGDYTSGISQAPYRNQASDLTASVQTDYLEIFLESRDDKDDSSKSDWVFRTIWDKSPKVVSYVETRRDQDYANRWKFEGAAFVGAIKTVVTDRARKIAGKPGFSSDPMMRFGTTASPNANEMLNQQFPTIPDENYPASFVGWKCRIVDRRNRVGYYRDDGSKTFVYEGGSRELPPDHFGRTEHDIVYWFDEEGTKVNFQTAASFPGARTAHDNVSTVSEAIIISLEPNGRTVERVVGDTVSLALLGGRTKIVQSADVIGWLQAGIAAQIDHFSQVRASYACEIEEVGVREMFQDVRDSRVAVIGDFAKMTILGTAANGGDAYKVGTVDADTGAVRVVGYAKLFHLRSATFQLEAGGFRVKWTLGSAGLSVQDVMTRFAKAATR